VSKWIAAGCPSTAASRTALMTSWNVMADAESSESFQSYPYAPNARIALVGGMKRIMWRAVRTNHSWLATGPGSPPP